MTKTRIALAALVAALALGAARPAAAQLPSRSAKVANTANAAKGDDAKAERRREKAARKAAAKALKAQPKKVMRGIELTKAEKAQVAAIDRRYREELKALDARAEAAAKAGKPMTGLARRIDALRMRERAELRAVVGRAHRARFDANVASL